MNLQHTGWSRVVLLLALSALLGCGRSGEDPRTNSGKQQPAIDAYNRGMGHANKGEFDDAIADFTEAIRLDPKYAVAYCDRGVIYEENGEDDKAIDDYTEAIRLDRTHARAYYNRGSAYYHKGEYDKAIDDQTKAIRLNLPKVEEAYANRGIAYAKKGKYDEAIADFTEAIRLEPEDAEAYYGRGIVYTLKGDQAKAEADFAKAKELGYETETTEVDSERDDASSGDVYDLGALQGLIGEWEYEAIAIFPDGEEQVSVGSSSIRQDLGGRFLIGRTRQDDGQSEALQIWTFYPDRKTYRHWYFHSDGETVEGIGRYDESTRSLTWETEPVDGTVHKRTERFADEDSYSWNGTLTDQAGVVVARIEGRLSRRE